MVTLYSIFQDFIKQTKIYIQNVLPKKVSELTNDAGYLTSHQDISGKQDRLTFDTTPTDGSSNPVTSGGIKTALDNKLDKTGTAVSATKLATARTISLTGNVSGSTTFDGSANASINVTSVNADSATMANTINNQGNKTAIKDGVEEPYGLNLYKVYDNGYPTTYGNLISIGGNGGGELLAGWSSTDNGIEHLYYRNRKSDSALWSNWSTVAFTTDINNFAPTKTGGGASGTWGINISGTATKANQDASGNVITDTYAKKTDVTVKGVKVDGATSTLVPDSSGVVTIPNTDLSNYYTKTQVDSAISTAISAIVDGDSKSY